MNDFGADALYDFLDWGMKKGLLKTATAKSRKVAAQKVLGALDVSEREDVRTVDADAAFQRFVNKNGREFTPQSLATYRSRFQTALDDFLRYRNSPASFKFDAQRSPKQVSGGEGDSARRPSSARTPQRAQVSAPAPSHPTPVSEVVFPIPIREGVIVRVHNLPNNLTKAEAQRISAVITALAMPDP